MSAALILLAAAGFTSARTLAWGGADATDGTRYKVSPVGTSHVLRPNQTVSPTRACRWSPPQGDPDLCAVRAGESRAFAFLRLVPHLLHAATLGSFAGLLLLFIPSARARGLPSLALGSAVLLALSAPWLWVTTVPRALVVLDGLDVGVGGTLGTLEISLAAAVLAGLAAAMLGRPLVTGLLVAMPSLAFLLMFPLPGAAGFAAGGIALGYLVGRATRLPLFGPSPTSGSRPPSRMSARSAS